MTALDLFPEVATDKIAALRRRTWARHQHNRVVDPNDNERYTLRPTIELCMRLAWRRMHRHRPECVPRGALGRRVARAATRWQLQ